MNNREEISSTRVRCDTSSNNALGGQSGRQSTVKDIAKLAGVSTATVSRVVNGSGTVSRKTRTKVLTAISRVQYRPNAHAAELGRENGGIPRRRSMRTVASGSRRAKPSH